MHHASTTSARISVRSIASIGSGEIVVRAQAEGRTVRAFHYRSHEISNLRRILGSDAITDLLEMFADRLTVMQRHYFAVAGMGLRRWRRRSTAQADVIVGRDCELKSRG
jgi:hypothetical protein